MANKWMPLFGTTALLLMAGCAAEYDERWVPPPQQSAEAQFDEDEPGSQVAPPANVRRKGTAYQRWSTGKAAYQKPGPVSSSPSSKTAGAAATLNKAPESSTASNKPLTPAEIRTAVPMEKVPNPARTLATARIKSVWG